MRMRDRSDLEVRCKQLAHIGGVAAGAVISIGSIPSIAVAPFLYEQSSMLSRGLLARGITPAHS